MGLIEMQVTEQFHHGRRNLLVTASIAIVLWLATSDSIKVPGLGTDVSLPASRAFSLVGLALFYFLVRYAAETSLVIARNSEALDDTDKPMSAEQHMRALADALQTKQLQLSDCYSRSWETLTRTEGLISSVQSEPLNEMELTSFIAQRLASFSRNQPGGVGLASPELPAFIAKNLIQVRTQAQSSEIEKLNTAIEYLRGLAPMLDRIIQEQQTISRVVGVLVIKLGRLSSRLGRVQRYSFQLWDRAVPFLLGFVGLLACADGAYSHFKKAADTRISAPKPAASVLEKMADTPAKADQRTSNR
jgi:hypothetical protein